jgi:hypothetical protein
MWRKAVRRFGKVSFLPSDIALNRCVADNLLRFPIRRCIIHCVLQRIPIPTIPGTLLGAIH